LVIDNCELAYDDSGPPAAPAVVLLHGFLGCKDDWQAVSDALGPRLRIVAVDLPGHGRTRVARFPDDYSIDAACRLIEELLDRLDLRGAILAGYSMGGRIALAYALRAGRRLRGLVLESASPGIADAAARSRRVAEDEQRATTLERDGLPAFVQAWESLPLFASQSALEPVARQRQRHLRLLGDARELAASLRAAGTGSQPWLGEHLSALPLPVLLVTGCLDSKFAAIAEQMLAALPDARWTAAEAAGHNVHLERPDFFASALAAFADEIAQINDNQGARP
ncbi:MAG: 2-succinyl-6-hydroxy-2,4-cyclohexadiene-1-carboxylate synthase, partial [Deltaproteobacteria bacterium]|nr:2-succinyl-6-hydroxy-2,4-cyclohexadiene-1-carboxylate synthase [Deltaproteobacteria bacterium]